MTRNPSDNAPPVEDSLTVDGFLDGNLKIKQPKSGFRAGSDAVLLGASVLQAGTLLDVGCGVGTAGLCALHRLPDIELWGLELQTMLAELATVNAGFNGHQARAHFSRADISDRRSLKTIAGPSGSPLLETGFDQVITNPPFYEKGRARPAETENKSIAHIEGDVDLKDWLEFCVARLKPKGQLSLIHRADRLAEILSFLSVGCGNIVVIPLWPDAKTPAKRVIVRAIKGSKAPLELNHGLVLHNMDGSPTDHANRLLREGCGLDDIL
jgi:tRNA1(Val) A37 N6-methylase TrmN6